MFGHIIFIEAQNNQTTTFEIQVVLLVLETPTNTYMTAPYYSIGWYWLIYDGNWSAQESTGRYLMVLGQ